MQVEEITQILRESPSVRLIKSRSVDFFLSFVIEAFEGQAAIMQERLLNISKRTLQRYRDNGLKYYTILHKTYYREKELHEFIRRYFDGENVEKGKTKECNGDERIEGGMLSDDKDEPMEEDKPVDEGKLTEDA